MYSLTFLSIIEYFLLYIGSVVLAFYIPGSVLIKSCKLRLSLHVPLSIIVGLCLWALQGFIFGYAGLRDLTYAYLVVFFVLWMRSRPYASFSKGIANVKRTVVANKIIVGIILLGTLIQLTTILFTMIPTDKGLFFCCGDQNDNTWFAAVTNELIHAVPPEQPGMAGVPLQNYHFLSNLVVAETARVFHIPFLLVQYQFNTILISLLYGTLAVVFGRLLHLTNTYILWLLFFLYFGSDAIYIILLALGKGINFSMSSLEDGVRFLSNLPRAYATVIAVGFLDLFYVFLKQRRLELGIILCLLGGSLIGYKVYVGIFVLTGLGFWALYEFVRFKDLRPAFVVLGSFFVSLGLYLPINAQAGGLYFTGLWRFENFIVQPALGLLHLEQARVIYTEHGNWIHVAFNEVIYIALYILTIFGSKLVGIIQTKKSMTVFPTPIHIVLISGMIVSLITGLFFNQTVGSSNTFNFLVSVFIFLSFYSSATIAYAFHPLPNIVTGFIVIAVILMTVPRVGYELSRNIALIVAGKDTIVRSSAMDASSYLKNHTDKKSLVLIDNREFWYDQNAPMFSILADRPMYLSGKGLLNHFDVDTASREATVRQIVQNSSRQQVASALWGTDIDYIVSSITIPPESTRSAIFLPVVYENKDVVIRKVDYVEVKKAMLSLDL
jgi:hypothetical protein